MAGCTTSGYDRTVTSSIAPCARQQNVKQRYSGMVTNDRTGYVMRGVNQ